MKSRLFYLAALALSLSACATNQPDEGPSLTERIKSATQSLTFVTEKSDNWCGPAKTCTYLGEIICEKQSENWRVDSKKECHKQLVSRAVQYGGDTIVLQQTGKVRNSQEHYRSFGQLYNCTGTNAALSKEYAAEYSLSPLSKIPVVSKAYAEQCKTTVGCELDKTKWSCGSSRFPAHTLCRVKFDRNRKGPNNMTINHIVYKDDWVNNAGFYRMYMDSYACK